MPVGGILFSEMTPAPEWAAEFHGWYDHEHIPVRMACPGFLGAQRYAQTDGPAFLAVYDMQTPEALGSPEYTAVKTQPSPLTSRMLSSVAGFTRYIGKLASWQMRPEVTEPQMLASDILYAVFFTVPAERGDDFDAWYTQDHVPLLLECPDWLGVRRYHISDGAPHPYTHVALHHLASADALNSPARDRARATPWRDRLAAEPWFKGSYLVFGRHGDRFAAG